MPVRDFELFEQFVDIDGIRAQFEQVPFEDTEARAAALGVQRTRVQFVVDAVADRLYEERARRVDERNYHAERIDAIDRDLDVIDGATKQGEAQGSLTPNAYISQEDQKRLDVIGYVRDKGIFLDIMRQEPSFVLWYEQTSNVDTFDAHYAAKHQTEIKQVFPWCMRGLAEPIVSYKGGGYLSMEMVPSKRRMSIVLILGNIYLMMSSLGRWQLR